MLTGGAVENSHPGSDLATKAAATDLYSHVMPAAHRDVADLLDRAMSPGG
jgi:hypothetical protein